MFDALDKARADRLRWFGQVRRRDNEYIRRAKQRLELAVRKSRWSLERSFKEEMKFVGLTFLVCCTYVANVWSVAGVRSQNAVQDIVIRPTLMMSRDMMET